MNLIHRSSVVLSLFLTLLVASFAANAQLPPPESPDELLSGQYAGTSYSPYAGRSFPTFPLWGDTHMYTIKAPQWASQVPAYLIGGVAAYWTIERTVGFWNL